MNPSLGEAHATIGPARVQHVYLDVVGFTKDRTVEAQSDVVGALNAIVSVAVREQGLAEGSVLFLPTGDGMAISLLSAPAFDSHLVLALKIIAAVQFHNSKTEDELRRYQVRIGVNENIDNLVLDINGRPNVAGAGIALAQRIMDQADAAQILVGSIVFDTLSKRERYFSKFRTYDAKDKHGSKFSVYQYLDENAPGLSNDAPSLLVPKAMPRPKLTKLAAFYIAHAKANEEFLLAHKRDAMMSSASIVLLGYLARDSVTMSSKTATYEHVSLRTWNAGKAEFPAQYEHYLQVDFYPLRDAAESIESKLADFVDLFVSVDGFPNFAFVSSEGIRRLVEEAPKIAARFGLAPKKK